MFVRRTNAAALAVVAAVGAIAACTTFSAPPARAAGEEEALKQVAQSIKAGKTDAAINLASNVLALKSASPAIVAKSYYLRGLAYQKAGKPAQAVADVSHALWLKQLSAADAAEATKVRAAVLGGTGKAIAGAGPEKVAVAAVAAVEPAAAGDWNADAAPVAAAAVVAPLAAVAAPAGATASAPVASWDTASVAEAPVIAAPAPAASQNSSAGIGGFFSSLFSSGTSEPAAPVANPVAGYADKPVAQSSGWSSAVALTPDDGVAANAGGETFAWSQPKATKPVKLAKAKPQAATVDSWQVAAVEAAPVVAAPVAEPAGGGLFSSISSLFGGDAAAEPVADQTASIAPLKRTVAKPVLAKPVVADAWSSEVTPGVAGTAAASVYDAPAAANTDFATTVEPVGNGGTFLLQVASAPSPAEAKAEAERIASIDPALVAQFTQRIVVTDLGAQGKFYQVQLGPFADERASLKACNRLKRSGVSCFLVVQ